MDAEERRALLAEVRQASNCSRPIRITGEMVDLATGEVMRKSLTVACKDRRRAVCRACSDLYQMDAFILISAGLYGGKGVSSDVAEHPRIFGTITAPSFGPVHRISNTGGCHPFADRHPCPHGRSRRCFDHHVRGALVLGTPICPDCFDYEGAVRWNAHVNRLWNSTVTRIRRDLGSSQGLSRREAPRHVTVSYFKVAEFQLRGLVHLHLVVRLDGPEGPSSPPPSWATAPLLDEIITRAVRRDRLTLPSGDVVAWGPQMRLIDVSRDEDTRRVAAYLAKYSIKTTDGSAELARRFESRRHVAALVGDHHRTMALTAWDLGFTRHAHAFGYPGNLITKSRSYSTTFREMREERAAYMAPNNDLVVIPGTFLYDGRGYLHPKAQDLAELFFAMDVELRKEAAQRKVSSEMNPSEEQSTAQTETPGRFNPQQIQEK